VAGGGGKGRRGKDKGKKTAPGRGKKKVSMGVAQHETEIGGGKKPGDVSVKDSWWLRDSVIDELKGRTWLASREG
jgi:anaphase-promoting complex subunit 1